MTRPLSILIVEDDPLIAMMIEDFVDSLGHRVAGVLDSVVEAVPRVAQGGFDVAILDVNIRDGASWPIADALKAQRIPFVLATGGHVEPPPADHATAPTLAKPFTLDGVESVLNRLASDGTGREQRFGK
jgi:CheY-like chemotaxis protein